MLPLTFHPDIRKTVMRISKTTWLMLAVGGLLLPASLATAQESSQEGVVRLGHKAKARQAVVRGQSAGPCVGGGCLSANDCDGCGVGYGKGGGRYRKGKGGGYAYGSKGQRGKKSLFGAKYNGGKCKGGACRGGAYGNCPHYGAASLYGGNCGYGCGHQCCLSKLLNGFSLYHTCSYSPDHGFAPPAQRPIRPVAATYRNMYPGQWTGRESGIDPNFRHPMIYMPTDTTQLGYYHQRVPNWTRRAGMIPPVPHPDEWHTPDTGCIFTGIEDAASYALNHCETGNFVEGGIADQGMPIESAPIESAPIESIPMGELSRRVGSGSELRVESDHRAILTGSGIDDRTTRHR